MVRLVLTESLRTVAVLVQDDETAPKDLRAACKDCLQQNQERSATTSDLDLPPTITHTLIQSISQYLASSRKTNYTESICPSSERQDLWSLTRGSQVWLDRPKPIVKSAALLALLSEIQDTLDNKAYANMVRSVAPPSSQNDSGGILSSIGSDLRDAKRQMSAVFNVLFSAVAVFVAVFWVSGTLSRDVGVRTLISLLGTLIVLIAEGWFFARDWLFDEPPPTPAASQARSSSKIPPAPGIRARPLIPIGDVAKSSIL
ncbi:endoplasmic reticulum-based factor for assembly of V-ATPase-domain-containing protein [Phlyctochytrium arcticum]|nr:endoplasmic reticulum-based factor for assembly of V-ATPase-domain-containing protein [Phlyctochytrium arcticum]